MLDLHIHTSFSSDGVYTPHEIFKMAKEKGISTISLTDHNEVRANFEALTLAETYGFKYIPGAEFNSFWNGRDVHILGYFIDYRSRVILDVIEGIKTKKFNQTKERVLKLKELGFLIELDDVLAETKGRPATGVSFLKAILKRDKNLKDERLFPYIYGEKSRSPYMNFYNDYLTPGKPAFVELKDIPTEQVIKIIIEAKGIPVIAHPKDMEEGDIFKLKEFGAMGLEAYSSYHDNERRQYYLNLAEKLNMVVTAGSDFHGESIKKDVKLGSVGNVATNIVDELERIYTERYGEKYRCM